MTARLARLRRALAAFDQIEQLKPDAREALAVSWDGELAADVGTLMASSRGEADWRHVSAPPAAHATRQGLPPGTVCGPFKLERLIGRGGTGEVYAASRIGEGPSRPVALKLLQAGHGAGPHEATVLGLLDHPGIIQLLGSGRLGDGTWWLATPLIDGPTLDVWARQARPTTSTRLELFCGLCAAVAHAHQRGIIHGDIKPANVVVDVRQAPVTPIRTDRGNQLSTRHHASAVLIDLGAALMVDEAGAAPQGGSSMTAEYAAPEQLEGKAATAATDIFGLGLLLYWLLAGTSPWNPAPHSDDLVAAAACDSQQTMLPSVARGVLATLILRAAIRQVPAPSRIGPAAMRVQPAGGSRSATAELDRIVLRAIHRDPACRYPTADSLRADVRSWLARHRPRPASWPGARPPWPAATGAGPFDPTGRAPRQSQLRSGQ
jgi:eukaryotic-like serine/threonine-protein kinase